MTSLELSRCSALRFHFGALMTSLRFRFECTALSKRDLGLNSPRLRFFVHFTCVLALNSICRPELPLRFHVDIASCLLACALYILSGSGPPRRALRLHFGFKSCSLGARCACFPALGRQEEVTTLGLCESYSQPHAFRFRLTWNSNSILRSSSLSFPLRSHDTLRGIKSHVDFALVSD